MKHIHHIIPKHMGGTDEPENLIELSIEEHAAAHLELYEKYGSRHDLWAYNYLSGNTKEAMLINCSAGGKIQGKINSETGHIQRIQKLSDCSAAGKKGGARTIELKKGAFGNPDERKVVASLGGKIQGKINSETGHLKRISALSTKTKGKIWITNGIQNKMILPNEVLPEGFYKGKVQKKNI